MKIIETTIYRCAHCNKLYQIKSACKKHEEDLCRRNPKFAHPCFNNCEHLDQADKSLYEDCYDGEHERIVTVFVCKKTDQIMHPGYVKEPFEFGDESNEKMPMECKDYETPNLDFFQKWGI